MQMFEWVLNVPLSFLAEIHIENTLSQVILSNRKSAINLDFDNKQNIDESIQNTENITTLI